MSVAENNSKKNHCDWYLNVLIYICFVYCLWYEVSKSP